jgi:CelD/BcsL family acetyltransferase involved in cellulose biosynthesis
LRDIADQADLRCRWNALVQRVEHPEVFFTWEWARAMEQAYADSLHPWLLVFENDDKSIAGIAAMATDASRRHISFLASTTADYCDFLSDVHLRETITDAVLGECAKMNASITLANLPADSSTLPAVQRLATRHGYFLHARPAYECAQVSLGAPQEREAVKADLRRKKLRRLIGTMEAQLSPQLQHLTSWQQIEAELPAFTDAHIARFEATGRRSNLADPRRQKFLQGLARLGSERGWLRLSSLRVDDKPVAWNYGFQFAGSWFWYQPTFDTQLEEFSPGVYLLAKIIQEACDDASVKVVDLGLGAEGYKERFANSGRQTVHVTLTRSYAEHLREVVRYRTAQTIKKWPRAEKVVRRILRRNIA